jgi:hypothetical protein
MIAGRLPDFVVVGVMKAGSTTLFRWLDEHPGVQMPADKEPAFFSDERVWRRGVAWYASLFADVPIGMRTGEASVAYADPRTADVVVPRLLDTLPDAALVCLLRDPAARLRSHYQHEVLRGRETRPLAEAVAEPGNAYVARSSYGAVLRPWLESAAAPRLQVVVSEELFVDDAVWESVLGHLSLPPIPRPTTAHNRTEGKAAFSPLMRSLWDAGVVDWMGRHHLRPPGAVRGFARRALLRDPARVSSLTEADAPLPSDVVDVLAAEVADAERLLGRPLPYAVGPAARS